MTPPAPCKICLGQWPFRDHQIALLGNLTAYLHEDQFFPGWTVLVSQHHATELYHLERSDRQAVMEAVTTVAQALAKVFHPVKVNYALLGNQLPHMHWHIVPRMRNDPAPQEPIWGVRHEPRRLTADELSRRLADIREALA